MLNWVPDIGLLKALIAMNDGRTDIVLTPPDQQVMEWARGQGYLVTVASGTAEIRPGGTMDDPPPPLRF
ncbi:hypothetical protein AB0J74_30950 [Asanoa sp. NPDC049573]|uniref:hypothetical protein n=1 Tax=Asanoa sp. NPDC049573 TaxID=3155396 RepID=UPI00341EB42F